jgi:5-methylthioadenosine/S-adenosylhomocysteine deaminase
MTAKTRSETVPAGPGDTSTIIKHVHAITMDDALGELPDADIVLQGNRIVAVGPGLEAADGAAIVDGSRHLALPGLIDTHRHLWMSLFRGWPMDGRLRPIQQELHHGYGVRMQPEDVYMAASVSLAESIDSGITTINAWEMNVQTLEHAAAVVRALEDSGMRGRYSYGPRTATPVAPVDTAGVSELQSSHFSSSDPVPNSGATGRIHLGMASRGVEMLEPDVWTQDFKFARENGIRLTAHVRGPSIEQLEGKDALADDLLAVHGVSVEQRHIDYLARAGVPISVATAPMAKIGEPSSPIVQYMRGGVRVCLSIDSVSASDNSDMFSIMRMSVLKERNLYGDPTVYSPAEALRQATIDGAVALGLGDVTGSLTPGKRADLILLRKDDTNMIPFNSAVAVAVFAAQPRNVESVWIDGVQRKREGRLVDFDVAALAERAQATITTLRRAVAAGS